MNNNYKIHYIGLSEGPINITTNKFDAKDGIDVQIKPIFRYRPNHNIMAIQFGVRFSYKGNELFSYGVVVSYVVEGGETITASISENSYPDDLIKQLLSRTSDIMRGALSIILKNTPYIGLTIPIIDLDKIYQITKKERM